MVDLMFKDAVAFAGGGRTRLLEAPWEELDKINLSDREPIIVPDLTALEPEMLRGVFDKFQMSRSYISNGHYIKQRVKKEKKAQRNRVKSSRRKNRGR